MKPVEVIAESNNFTAINIGNLDQLMEHSTIHPKSHQEIVGKIFLKELTKASGTEISFQMLPPKTELPYFHAHRKNEETYIIIKGLGYYQVDEEHFPIREGSVIRVAPNGKRSIYNSSDEPMIYITIQSKENSLEEYSADDGDRIDVTPKWYW